MKEGNTAEIIRELCKQDKRLTRINGGVNYTELSRVTGSSQPLIHSLVNGTRNPSYKTIKILSDYFGVTKEQLIGEESLDVAKLDIEFRRMWHLLDENEQEAITAMIAIASSKNKNAK